jgi:hypothetical protein
MKVKWVYENVTGFDSFYSKLNITLLISSVCLWKKYHPEHTTILYVDELTYDKFLKLDIIYLWNKVKILDYKDNVNRKVLWAGCKPKIISQTKSAMLIIDHDFLIFKNVDDILKDEVIYSYDEDMSQWYINPNDKYNKQLTSPIEFIQDKAANVSFLYLPNVNFAIEYGQQTIDKLTQFTAILGDNLNTSYLTACEQYQLKELLHKKKIKHKTLNKNIYSCEKVKFKEEINDRGIWDLKESFLYYKHYGVEKRRILDNREGYNYDKSISYLYRCINSSKLINVEYLNNKINTHISTK